MLFKRTKCFFLAKYYWPNAYIFSLLREHWRSQTYWNLNPRFDQMNLEGYLVFGRYDYKLWILCKMRTRSLWHFLKNLKTGNCHFFERVREFWIPRICHPKYRCCLWHLTATFGHLLVTEGGGVYQIRQEVSRWENTFWFSPLINYVNDITVNLYSLFYNMIFLKPGLVFFSILMGNYRLINKVEVFK